MKLGSYDATLDAGHEGVNFMVLSDKFIMKVNVFCPPKPHVMDNSHYWGCDELVVRSWNAVTRQVASDDDGEADSCLWRSCSIRSNGKPDHNYSLRNLDPLQPMTAALLTVHGNEAHAKVIAFARDSR